MHNNTPRPSLDPVTIWRAEQVAKAESRSLANAVRILVGEAWTARQAAALAHIAPKHVVDEIAALTK